MNSLNLYRSNAARGFKLEQHNRPYRQPRFHAAKYRALKELVFCQLLICYKGHAPEPKSVKKHSFEISGRLTSF